MKEHQYTSKITWTGNKGKDTKNYSSYSRSFEISHSDKSQVILGSSDPNFLGDPSRHNPEELLLTSISSCHLLWYLHLCAANKINVSSYMDLPIGTMEELPNGSGKFTGVTLLPTVTIRTKENLTLATQLHKKAHELCFIANSCNFPIECSPTILVAD